VWEENQIHIFSGEIQDSTVCDLGRETETGVALQLPSWIDARQDDIHPKSRKEVRKEREERVRRQGLRYPNPKTSTTAILRGSAKEQMGSLFHQIGGRPETGPPFPNVLEQTASASERKPSSRHLETVDGAKHFAGLAGEAAQ
jgi:hypothetical protein